MCDTGSQVHPPREGPRRDTPHASPDAQAPTDDFDESDDGAETSAIPGRSSWEGHPATTPFAAAGCIEAATMTMDVFGARVRHARRASPDDD